MPTAPTAMTRSNAAGQLRSATPLLPAAATTIVAGGSLASASLIAIGARASRHCAANEQLMMCAPPWSSSALATSRSLHSPIGERQQAARSDRRARRDAGDDAGDVRAVPRGGVALPVAVLVCDLVVAGGLRGGFERLRGGEAGVEHEHLDPGSVLAGLPAAGVGRRQRLAVADVVRAGHQHVLERRAVGDRRVDLAHEPHDAVLGRIEQLEVQRAGDLRPVRVAAVREADTQQFLDAPVAEGLRGDDRARRPVQHPLAAGRRRRRSPGAPGARPPSGRCSTEPRRCRGRSSSLSSCSGPGVEPTSPPPRRV